MTFLGCRYRGFYSSSSFLKGTSEQQGEAPSLTCHGQFCPQAGSLAVPTVVPWSGECSTEECTGSLFGSGIRTQPPDCNSWKELGNPKCYENMKKQGAPRLALEDHLGESGEGSLHLAHIAAPPNPSSRCHCPCRVHQPPQH